MGLVKHIKHAIHVVHSVIREALKKRSSKWPKVRKDHLLANPTCAACAGKKRMQVHHVDPYHLDPAKELDPTNLISLCMTMHECHLKIGHGSDFRAFNPNSRHDARLVLADPTKRAGIEAHAKTVRMYEETK